MKKVYCPWCGSEMIPDSNTYYPSLMCSNEKCAAVAPFGHSLEEAYKVADRRVLQKPLTLEEFQESGFAFIELNEEHYESYVFPAFYVAKVNGFWTALLTKRTKMITDFFDEYEENEILIENNEYGMAWRCWETKPSDEERSAAKWE